MSHELALAPDSFIPTGHQKLSELVSAKTPNSVFPFATRASYDAIFNEDARKHMDTKYTHKTRLAQHRVIKYKTKVLEAEQRRQTAQQKHFSSVLQKRNQVRALVQFRVQRLRRRKPANFHLSPLFSWQSPQDTHELFVREVLMRKRLLAKLRAIRKPKTVESRVQTEPATLGSSISSYYTLHPEITCFDADADRFERQLQERRSSRSRSLLLQRRSTEATLKHAEPSAADLLSVFEEATQSRSVTTAPPAVAHVPLLPASAQMQRKSCGALWTLEELPTGRSVSDPYTLMSNLSTKEMPRPESEVTSFTTTELLFSDVKTQKLDENDAQRLQRLRRAQTTMSKPPHTALKPSSIIPGKLTRATTTLQVEPVIQIEIANLPTPRKHDFKQWSSRAVEEDQERRRTVDVFQEKLRLLQKYSRPRVVFDTRTEDTFMQLEKGILTDLSTDVRTALSEELLRSQQQQQQQHTQGLETEQETEQTRTSLLEEVLQMAKSMPKKQLHHVITSRDTKTKLSTWQLSVVWEDVPLLRTLLGLLCGREVDPSSEPTVSLSELLKEAQLSLSQPEVRPEPELFLPEEGGKPEVFKKELCKRRTHVRKWQTQRVRTVQTRNETPRPRQARKKKSTKTAVVAVKTPLEKPKDRSIEQPWLPDAEVESKPPSPVPVKPSSREGDLTLTLPVEAVIKKVEKKHEKDEEVLKSAKKSSPRTPPRRSPRMRPSRKPKQVPHEPSAESVISLESERGLFQQLRDFLASQGIDIAQLDRDTGAPAGISLSKELFHSLSDIFNQMDFETKGVVDLLQAASFNQLLGSYRKVSADDALMDAIAMFEICGVSLDETPRRDSDTRRKTVALEIWLRTWDVVVARCGSKVAEDFISTFKKALQTQSRRTSFVFTAT